MIHKILQHLIWYVIKFLISTYRIQIKRSDRREKAKKLSPYNSFVFALWHEQLSSVMSAMAWTEPFLTLASKSKDGDYAAFIAQKMGFIPLRGSSRKRSKDKGGKEAIFAFIDRVKKSVPAGITVDGPKGPRRKCKPGVVIISQQTGVPVLPIIAVPSHYWEFNSWDRFKLPKPFSKITVLYGEPIFIQSGEAENSIQEGCELVASKLEELEKDLLLNNY